jgi:hypothetical protein
MLIPMIPPPTMMVRSFSATRTSVAVGAARSCCQVLIAQLRAQ